ncbi:MAG: AmmeMemoRadiSam system protein A [Candidatus Paceibacterota bacterium]
MLSETLKKGLLISRSALEARFFGTEILKFNNPEFQKKAATFVTLKINGQLRGCVGNLEPYENLAESIVRNTRSSAFSDDRFPPVSIEELKKIKIELSIISDKKTINFRNPDELLNKIRPGVDGIIISYKNYSATFLPQVWQEIKSKRMFLCKLCEKAGLNPKDWQKLPIRVEVYQIIKISE